MSTYDDTCMALGIGVMSATPTLLWGGPGEGKTSVLTQISTYYGWHMETVIASIREPSDFAGLPVVHPVTGTVRLAPPQWAQTLHDLGGGIVFYDEISTAAPAVQGALLRPILDNCVGELNMGPNVRTVAAANPADIAAGGWDLAPPMANRFLHLQWSLPADVIRDGFSLGWKPVPLPQADPDNLSRLIAESKVLVGTFIAARPELRSRLPESSEEAGGPFPTPRSWEMAATLYGYALACGANSNVVQLLISGSVGARAAGEFLTFVAHLDLPDPEVLIANPEAYVVPLDRGDKVYATASSVLVALLNNQTPERWRNTGAVFGKMADAGYSDIAFTYARKWAAAHDPSTGVMPTEDTTRALGPVLAELGALVSVAN